MRRAWLLGTAGLAGLALGWALFEYLHQQRIYPGVVAAGVQVGGLTVEEATARIAATVEHQAPPRLTLKAGEQSLEVLATELGWQPDPKATAEQAFAVGRGRLAERLAALRGQVEVPLVARLDPKAVAERLRAIAKRLERPPRDARVVYQKGRYQVLPEEVGLQLDVQAALETYLRHPGLRTLEFFPRPVAPRLTAGMLEGIATQANQLLRPIVLVYEEPGGQTHRHTLGVDQVAALLQVGEELQVNRKRLGRLLEQLAARHDRLPENARYVVGPGGRLEVRPEKDGFKLNQPESLRRLEVQLLRPDLSEFRLVAVPKRAQVRVTDLPRPEDLQLLAEATTTYAGSSPERIANVHAAARNLDGYVVPPGGMFDFNQAVGHISPENGFKEALVISGGRTVKGVGGGVCQVSTTAFRALYQAGLPIVERNPHAYRVRWYDPIVGYDAAVYQPYLNLRAQNDTPGPLVVRTAYTRSSLTVRLYGIPDGRKVTVSPPVILSRTPHPPPQYIVDPSLRPGEVKQVDWAVDGFRTRITRTITRPDGSVEVHELHSNFRPWRAVYLVGPKTPEAASD
ncbi:Vancomycin B-type resistance protein VanW [Meiothermus luteus]|uniref:Vancomycin B-type resistance protein VanW n=1 Tax=Meiothermus luteus TaxID=2026184 RepID=A0A399EYC2_9DEIN|nr:VanW family protein [Meiothermus luteus]RIH89018.1 Vancomycin B-type resistance protein VanW [Meiothermus luteus]